MEDNSFDRPLEPTNDKDVDAAYTVIFSMFAKLVPGLPSDAYTRFGEVTFPVRFMGDQVILDYGQICSHLYLTLTGLVRLSRNLDSRGETTVMFLGGGDIVIAPDSFYTQTRSAVKLTALTDTFCIALPWSQLQLLYQEFTEFNVVARLLTEQYYRQALERFSWFYENPELRYEHVLKAYPNLTEHVSVKEFASYLGIAPETLSRIRNNIYRKRKRY